MKRSTKGLIEIETASCPICESPLRTEIEQHDLTGKDQETIKWARRQGLDISKFSLLKHRVNHLPVNVSGDNGNNDDKDNQASVASPIRPDESQTSRTAHNGSRSRISGGVKRTSGKHGQAEKGVDSVKTDRALSITNPEKCSSAEQITDQLLLDAVRDRVYRKLVNEEIELNLGDGFKAVEIKHKIAAESQNEKLLLEILNEIRAEELKS